MIIAWLIVLGLVLGSFVNALVWRIHEQDSETIKKRPSKHYLKQLSISKGRSMCPDCHHELTAKDLIPVLSWLQLGGKCRYCHKPISAQYPLIEVAMAAVFVVNYVYWPVDLTGHHIVIFSIWLLELVGLMALAVYDARWFLLPNRILYPLGGLAAAQAIIGIAAAKTPLHTLLSVISATLIGGGLFYVLFQVSKGRWIGGGDVKLGWVLGLTAGTAAQSLLFIFMGALAGTIASIPLLATGRLKQGSLIPFGPFLILGAVIARLFGVDILNWYLNLLH